MRRKTLLHVFLLFIFSFWTVQSSSCNQAAAASSKKIVSSKDKSGSSAEEKAGRVVIPVFYLTDRNLSGDTYGPERRYPVKCEHEMYYGTAFVETDQKESSIEGLHQRLGWTLDKAQKAPKFCRKDKIDQKTDIENKQEFFSRVIKAVADSGDNRLCIWVPGAADPFEDTVFDAAEMAYYMECPVVAYSWPSVGKLKDYHIDEGNCEWSQEHFNTFCTDFRVVQEAHPQLRISLVAHSMGNRLVARATSALEKSHFIVHDIALVSPDVDAGTFMHYVMNYHNRGAKVRLYVSERDKVLSFTQMIYGGYYRLGEEVGPVLDMITGHHAESVRAAVARGNLPQKKSLFEKIDYTELDSKAVGHRFPFSLVANMSRWGAPGQGLALVQERVNSSGNRLARFARWRYRKLDGADDTTEGAESASGNGTGYSGSASSTSESAVASNLASHGSDASEAHATASGADQKQSHHDAPSGSSCERVVFVKGK